MKLLGSRFVDIALSLIFMGSMWQLEIAKLNLLNGDYPFGFLFSLLFPINNWAASDFWMLLMTLSFIGVALNGRVATEK